MQKYNSIAANYYNIQEDKYANIPATKSDFVVIGVPGLVYIVILCSEHGPYSVCGRTQR